MLISVVIPAYNRAQYIEEAIQTVLDQKLPHDITTEVIVVDDGSTDNTLEVIKRFGKKIQVYAIEHSGKPAVARNFGISKARGEFIAFQDSDDRWALDRLANQMSEFSDPAVVMVHGQASVITEAGEETNRTVTSTSSKPTRTTFENLVDTNTVSTLTVTMRKSTIDELGGFDETDEMRAIEDYHLWLRTARLSSKKVVCLPQVLAYYRQHAQNISNEGFGTPGSSEYEAKALSRIIRVLQSILLDGKNTDEQAQALQSRVDQCINGMFNFRNPGYATRDPKISVILPMYNAEEYIRETLDSILSQTFRDFEVIAIDDGSKDHTASIVASYQDPRIKLYRQKNRGLVFTLNRGLGLARGAFIARHDSDDISLPTRFEKQYTYLTCNPDIGLVSCFFTYFGEGQKADGLTITNPYMPQDVRRSLFLLNPIAHGGVLARKSLFSGQQPYKEEYLTAEDYHMWCSFAGHAQLSILPETLYLYRLNPEGISATKFDTALKTTAQIIDEQWQKPFPLKSYKAIIEDALYYRAGGGQFSSQVYAQYVSQQYELSRKLIAKGWLRPAVLTAAATTRLNRKNYVLIKPIVKLTLRKLKQRLHL